MSEFKVPKVWTDEVKAFRAKNNLCVECGGTPDNHLELCPRLDCACIKCGKGFVSTEKAICTCGANLQAEHNGMPRVASCTNCKSIVPEGRACPVCADQRPLFNEWFSGVLLQQETCLLRDVLRDSKDVLYIHWLKRRPYDE